MYVLTTGVMMCTNEPTDMSMAMMVPLFFGAAFVS
jgi:hypothetical protein